MHQRTLLTGSTTGGERDDGRQGLDRSDDGADVAALVVEGVDHSVGARALGFGREAVSQVAAEQAAQRRQQQQQPQVLSVGRRVEKGEVEWCLIVGMDLAVASQFLDQQELG